MAQGNEAATLAALPAEVTFKGERVEVHPLTFGTGLKLLAKCAPVVDAFARTGMPVQADGDLLAVLLYLAERHTDVLPQALSIASGLPVETIESADFDDVTALAIAIYEVNADFFGQRVAPRLQPLLARARGTAPTTGDGTTPPTPSSVPDTA